ncbi:aminotransferase class IV [Curvibacter sp. APW13]|uniref:aminotransferase class IV n=1 Tax=Curvibacter sp. APW13 TaxID=3077236 RepID=UPI0028DDB8EA|nr:aminotransferase class IV [Curvibacter sp. APW13]MDT8990664.1 aminotransferase class IV [Curvibacter sp. APW13]
MASLPSLPCYLNGEYTTIDRAQVSVMDRGFLLGDGIYEVVPFYAGRPFRWPQHLARLRRSLELVRIALPLSDDELLAVAMHLVATHADSMRASGQFDPKNAQMVYFQVTRGVALRDHTMLPGLTPTVFAMVNTLALPSASQRAQGVACVTADDFRWEMAHIKSTSLLGAVLTRQIGVDADAVETAMFRDGYLSEGASSNLWVVKDGHVFGPPKNHLVLEGVRYGFIEEACAQAGIPFTLRPIPRADVLAADELLLSSAGKEVLAVTTLDGQPVGNGRPGPIYDTLYAAYRAASGQD